MHGVQQGGWAIRIGARGVSCGGFLGRSFPGGRWPGGHLRACRAELRPGRDSNCVDARQIGSELKAGSSGQGREPLAVGLHRARPRTAHAVVVRLARCEA
jgi:hypothetical protein